MGDEASAQAHAAYKGTLQLQYYQPYYNMALPQMMGSTDANVALVLTRLNGLRSVAESTKAKEDRSEAQIVALSKQVEALKDRLPEKGEDK